jgi:uncharacterized 2Fe-2S/4Fe-4S cluster protein (DUF4445 family)
MASERNEASVEGGEAGAGGGPAKTVTVIFQPSGRRFEVAEGEVLFEVAAEAGVDVDTVCGGNGSCGKCKVRFDTDPPAPDPLDYMHLSGGEIAQGYRLSCQVRAARDMSVQVPESGARAKVQILHHGVARSVDLQPNVRKLYAPYVNPREAENVADWDRLRMRWPRTSRPREISLDLLRMLPAAIRDAAGMTLLTAGRRVIGIETGNTTARQYGVAFDIGSTTVVGFLVDLGTGADAAVASAVNAQAVYGDDIIGRLSRAQRNPEGLAKLHAMIVEQLNAILGELTAEAGIAARDICEVTVVGNMAMHHFLLRLDSTYLGLSPYAPVTRSAVATSAGELALALAPETPLYVLPNVAGFVGSDTVSVILATNMGADNALRMAIDVGTNGEMALGNRKRLIACSAPAGPAFEGARIKMGMRAAPGAIDHVWIEDDVRLTVIGEVPPQGICGSALIDIVAQLLDAGLLNHAGAYIRHEKLDPRVPQALRDRLIEAEKRRDSYFILARKGEHGAEQDIIFTQQDVREMQLAKGAIRAGTMMLLQEMGLDDAALEEVMLAGAFGNFIDARNALRCGLTPQVPLARITSVGNAAGVGARIALVNVVERRRAERLADRTEHIQLSGSNAFQKAFTHAMQFPKS